jgi:predicted dehydrogenase
MLAEGTIGQMEGGRLDVMISDDKQGYDAGQNPNDVVPTEIRVEFGNMYAKEIESFGRSILDGIPIEVPLEEGLQVQGIVESAYASSRCGTFLLI